MAKITRAQLQKRKRIEMYKKVIIYGFLMMTIVPIFTSLFLFYKLGTIEDKLEYALSDAGKDYATLRSSKEALVGKNPDVLGVFDDNITMNLSNANTDRNSAANTEDQEKAPEKNTEETTSIDESVKETKRVYLTFDDGPSIYTGQILDILAVNNVKATFFVIGKDESYYEYYKRIVDEGHTIGMHSYSHVYQDLYASRENFETEINQLRDLIYSVTGEDCTIFRFPGGSSNHVSSVPVETFISYLNEQGITYYDWNALNGDAISTGLSPEQLVNNIMNDVEKNKDSIVLMHDLQTTHSTVESLQLLIDTLKAEGYEILPIDENTPLIQHVSSAEITEE